VNRLPGPGEPQSFALSHKERQQSLSAGQQHDLEEARALAAKALATEAERARQKKDEKHLEK
jgi:hypothetical protein